MLHRIRGGSAVAKWHWRRAAMLGAAACLALAALGGEQVMVKPVSHPAGQAHGWPSVGFVASVGASEGAADFFVAPNGSDRWSGRLAEPNAAGTDGPFATIHRARDAVRELTRPGPGRDVTVLIRAGTYYLSETLTLGLVFFLHDLDDTAGIPRSGRGPGHFFFKLYHLPDMGEQDQLLFLHVGAEIPCRLAKEFPDRVQLRVVFAMHIAEFFQFLLKEGEVIPDEGMMPLFDIIAKFIRFQRIDVF